MMELRPVGVVRSAIRDRKDLPPLGAPAAVEVFPEFAGALLHLEKHSHLWVLAWLDEAARDVVQVKPRGLKEGGDEALHGVFAVRSPSRPNPIGLTAARIVQRRGLRIDLDRLDFSDGTPVVDLKPYFATRDLIFSARNAQIGRPADTGALRSALDMQALAFCGRRSDDLDLAVEILTHFRSEVLEFADPETWHVTVPMDRPDLLAAVLGMTRAVPRFHETASVRFEHDGSRYEYELSEDGFRFYPH